MGTRGAPAPWHAGVTLLTVAACEAAFRVHLDEIDRFEKNACHWALRHLVVVIPDISGAPT